jgi:NDP-sugar pyrophosphorylase family protein
MNEVDVVLLCGGKGTRLYEVTNDKLPKSLYILNGRPLIDYTIEALDFARINRLIFAVDYHADLIIDWVKGQKFACEVVISHQVRDGILGAVESALCHISSEHFIVCNTDEVRLNFSMSEFLDAYDQTEYKSAMATALSSQLYRHRVVIKDSRGKIIATELKNEHYKKIPHQKGVINTGFLLFSRDIVYKFNDYLGCDWSSMIDPLVEAGGMQSVQNSRVCYFNVGTSTELKDVSSFLRGCDKI